MPCHGAKGGPGGLIAAIEAANAHGGGTIALAGGCSYALTKGQFDKGNGRDGLPPIHSPITIDGHGASIVRTNGAPVFRLFQVEDATSAKLTLNEVDLKHGDTGGSGPALAGGGAILVTGRGTLTLRDSVLANNTSANGGAIASNGGTVLVTGSVLRRNHGTEALGGVAGAILNNGGRLVVRSSTLTDNDSTAKGGAISSPAGLARVITSTISDNSVAVNGTGGGIFNFAKLTVYRSTISGNHAHGFGANGGAIANYSQGNLSVDDSTLSDNTAGETSAEGGAIVNFGKGTITDATIASNRAIGPGATGGGIIDHSPLTVTATIVADNNGDNCAGKVHDGGFNLENGTSCGFEKHAVNAQPLLKPLADYGGPTETRALKPGSPAIDRVPARNLACGGTVDQRGVQRPQGQRCDIGAFEFAIPRITISSPRNGAQYKKGSHLPAAYRCEEGGITSPIASCTGTVRNGQAINTDSLGTKSFTVTATDKSGNQVKKTVRYTVMKGESGGGGGGQGGRCGGGSGGGGGVASGGGGGGGGAC